MYNFSEIILNSQYSFDYQINEGSCRSRNAIKLLEISNYPKEVLQNALNTVRRTEKSPIKINSGKDI